MTIKNTTTSAVLGLLFLSLLAIYVITAANGLVTFLSVLIMLVGLVISQSRNWRDIGILAVMSGLVSLVAAALIGNARFGTLGMVIVTVVWGAVLLALFSWTQRNMLKVEPDRAILISNRFNDIVHVAEGPISSPITPFVERQLAIIPLYDLSQKVRVEKANAKAGHNIDEIEVDVRYRIAKPERAVRGMPNQSQLQADVAKEMKVDTSDAMHDVGFWERLLCHQMSHDVDEVVRGVIYQNVLAQNAIEIYGNRKGLSEEIESQLSKRVVRWGVEIRELEIIRIQNNPDIIRGIKKKDGWRDETELKKLEADREAYHIRATGEAEAEIEAKRVTELIRAIQAEGIQLSADELRELVIDAIHASSDGGFDNGFTRPAGDLAPTRVVIDKKDNVAKK